MPYLTVPTKGGRCIHPVSSRTLLGRGPECSICLDDVRASRQHAEIYKRGGNYFLRDIGSTNGTFVGGVQVVEPVMLEDGVEVSIGETTLLFTRGAPKEGSVKAVSHAPLPEARTLCKTTVGMGELSLEDENAEPRGATVKKERGKDGLPPGTTTVPLNRFAVCRDNEDDASAGARKQTVTILRLGGRLQGLYRLLREAAACRDEDSLLQVMVRVPAETLPGARVSILFERNAAGTKSGRGRRRKKPPDDTEETLPPVPWREPENSRGRRTSRLFSGTAAALHTALTAYTRRHAVALATEDIVYEKRGRRKKTTGIGTAVSEKESQAEAENGSGGKGRERRISLLLAPLRNGNEFLGWLAAERTIRYEDRNDNKTRRGRATRIRHTPFVEEDLDFLAAAAQPLADLWAAVRRQERKRGETTRLRAASQTAIAAAGESVVPLAIRETVSELVASDTSVLLVGEDGTETEAVARFIHDRSPRRERPFLTFDCKTTSGGKPEEELFGQGRDSFGNSSAKRQGSMEAAAGGTLFLKNVAYLPPAVQTKLLHALETRKTTRTGEVRLRRVGCRILASVVETSTAAAAPERLRRKLRERLAAVRLRLPPLRERKEELPELCKHLLGTARNEFNLSPEALAFLTAYRWPGNERELRCVLERMMLLARWKNRNKPGEQDADESVTLLAADVPLDIRVAVVGAGEKLESPDKQIGRGKRAANTPEVVAGHGTGWGDAFVVPAGKVCPTNKLQFEYARWVLEQVGGNKSRAAELLGVQRSTLYAWTEWREKSTPAKTRRK